MIRTREQPRGHWILAGGRVARRFLCEWAFVGRRLRPGYWLLCLSLLLPFAANALESDATQPIMVEADGAEINDRSGVSVYTGNVVITQGTIKINADKVTVTQRDQTSDHVLAEGNPVKFQQQSDDQGQLIKGRARRAEYYLNSEVLHMSGDAVLRQGKDSFSSDRIVYDRIKAQVRAGSSAQGKERVRISIQPRKRPEKTR